MNKIYLSLLMILLFRCGERPSLLISGLEGQPLPAFNMILADSITKVNTNDIPVGKPVILFLFSPTCPYCKAQTENIIDEISTISDIQIYFLSSFPLSAIKDFVNQYRLNKYKNIIVAQDYGNYFANYYKAPGVPFIAVYDKNRHLKQVMIGQVSTYKIRQIAFE